MHSCMHVNRDRHVALYEAILQRHTAIQHYILLYFNCYIFQNTTLHFEFWHQNRKGGSVPCIMPPLQKMSVN